MVGSGSPQRLQAAALLAAVALVWGSTFVLVKAALRDVSPLLFNLLRMLLATAVLWGVHRKRLQHIDAFTWKAGAATGVLLGAGYQLQTAGLAQTTAVKSAFLTGLLVVLVPLFSFVPRLRGPHAQPPRASALLGAGCAFAGLFALATPPGTQPRELWSALGAGDLLSLGCAVAFAAHLLVLSRSSKAPTEQMVTLQIGFAAALMLCTLPLGGAPHLHWTAESVLALGVTGVLATAAAFSAQTWAQQHLSAGATALLLTLEPVFALLFSLLFLGERLSLRAGLGAALILLGITITELFAAPTPLPPEPI